MKSLPKLGGHVSCEGGLPMAIERATALGMQTFQLHPTSPRQWIAKIPADPLALQFTNSLKQSKISSFYIHAPYLINLATPNPDLLVKSKKNLEAQLIIGNKIGAHGVVVHLGSSTGTDKQQAIKREIKAIKEVLKSAGGRTMLLLENSAAGGDKVGATLEEISQLIKGVNSKRVGVCYDTAHGFEAGLIEEYSAVNIKKFLDKFNKLIGLKNLIALHVNDSKTIFNSQHDRHDNLGEGHIGLKGFKNLAAEKRLHHCAWLLEVPGFNNEGPDLENMKILRSCFGQ
jgi:deoxyribonuclease-4